MHSPIHKHLLHSSQWQEETHSAQAGVDAGSFQVLLVFLHDPTSRCFSTPRADFVFSSIFYMYFFSPILGCR